MTIHHIRLMMSVLFLLMGLALLLRGGLFPPEFYAKFKALHLDFGGVFAVLIAAWNLSRWYAARNYAKPQPRTRHLAEPTEYNPEFDFEKKS